VTIFYDWLIAPFADFGFMRRAALGCILLSCSATPLGILLMLRRMSLMGDAMGHAILPGVAVGFLLAGLSLPAMGLGGLAAGLVVVLLVGAASRATQIKEDANMAAFYLIALAMGVLLISLHGSSLDLIHLLFGTLLAIDTASLRYIAGATSATLILLSIFYRPLIADAFDPIFLRTMTRHHAAYHFLFLALVVINLVAGFQALGTLMCVGLMMLPAAAARLWTQRLGSMIGCAMIIAVSCSMIGLLLSYHINLPSGPAVILSLGIFFAYSILMGRVGSIRSRYFARRHFAA
jgi:zinc/manganese transport system permease protein